MGKAERRSAAHERMVEPVVITSSTRRIWEGNWRGKECGETVAEEDPEGIGMDEGWMENAEDAEMRRWEADLRVWVAWARERRRSSATGMSVSMLIPRAMYSVWL